MWRPAYRYYIIINNNLSFTAKNVRLALVKAFFKILSGYANCLSEFVMKFISSVRKSSLQTLSARKNNDWANPNFIDLWEKEK